jgi:hypothetical protein
MGNMVAPGQDKLKELRDQNIPLTTGISPNGSTGIPSDISTGFMPTGNVSPPAPTPTGLISSMIGGGVPTNTQNLNIDPNMQRVGTQWGMGGEVPSATQPTRINPGLGRGGVNRGRNRRNPKVMTNNSATAGGNYPRRIGMF